MRPSAAHLQLVPTVPPEGERVPPSASEIVLGVKRGERWAGRALYDRLGPVVERTLRRVLPGATQHELEDLLQGTFEQIARGIWKDRLDQVLSLEAWATSVATHVAVDALRLRFREKRRFLFGASSEERPAPGCIETQVQHQQQLARISSVLAKMRPDQVEVLLLHDAMGHELAEVAVMMGISVAAAQSRLVRGRTELLRRAKASVSVGEI